jgi:hypothetical protein
MRYMSVIAIVVSLSPAMALAGEIDNLLQRLRQNDHSFSIGQNCTCSNPNGNLGDKDCRNHRYWICRQESGGSGCQWEQGAEYCQ